MKQKDIAIIVITVFIAGIFSYLICNNFLFTAQDHSQKVEVVTPITDEFNLPDKTVFNGNATNPTKVIEIGPNANDKPFTNTQ